MARGNAKKLKVLWKCRFSFFDRYFQSTVEHLLLFAAIVRIFHSCRSKNR